ncbi:BA14K family protein [Aliihoeflea sp. 2WW]|uniref:BA14K family protein n=1 Tax=Aliihoeflea sp. 2WW TaxID=1381123 RepID=UPI000465D093|nr:BA14K family protein [Aliihoeflea sp. 2WW]
MKPLLAAATGFTLSLGMFAGGAVLATYTLSAKPVAVKTGPTQDVADLWTAEARAIDPGAQDLERVAAAPLPPEPEMTAEAGAGEEITLASADPSAWPGQEAAIDETTTFAIGEAPADGMQDAGLPVAHLQWCAERYRSYRPETNSYTPYGGGSKTCASPYAESGQAGETMMVAQAAMEEPTSQSGRHVETASRHVQSCFDRYRSYRPEDNSYQPYGGGPRQQCE